MIDNDQSYAALKRTVDSMNKTLKESEKKIQKVVNANVNRVKKIEGKTNKCMKDITKKMTELLDNEQVIKDSLLHQMQSFKGIEDTFYTLYHNIQKNQFLYATNPEVWRKDNLDLKKHYQEENKEFEVKCTKIEEKFFYNIFYQALKDLQEKEWGDSF